MAKWLARHNFVLPDAQLLIPSQKGKLWMDFNKDPPQVRVWLAEELRTRSCISRAVGHQLTVEPGGAVAAFEVIADCVDKSFELFVRIRAFLMTLAYVSISREGWFPLQVAMEISEQVMGFITNTFDGRTPPVQFLVGAWPSTIHYFSEQIRIHKKKIG